MCRVEQMFFDIRIDRARKLESLSNETNKKQNKATIKTNSSASSRKIIVILNKILTAGIMKPTIVADEMFPEHGAGIFMDLEEAGGSGTSSILDLAANEKDVHADFYNSFDDLFDEDDEQNMN